VERQQLQTALDHPEYRVHAPLFNRSDGLPSTEVGGSANSSVLRDREGRLWFATVKGLAFIHPRQLELGTNPPAVSIERIQYRDRKGVIQTLPWDGKTSVSVPAGVRQLVFSWAATGLSAPEKLRYSYLLGGSGGLWLDAGNRRTIDLHVGSPETVVLQVRAASGDGVWNLTGATVAVTVTPFFWQLAWVEVLALAGLLGATGVGVWKVVEQRQRRRIEQLEREALLKQQLARDMEVIRRAEEALRVSEERFRTAMENSPVGMAIVGLEGRWIELNAALCRIFGYSSAELLKLDLATLEHPDDQGIDADQRRRMFAREIPSFEIERRYIHRQGHTLWANMSASLVWNSNQTPRHLILHIQDVTERVLASRRHAELEEQLRQTQKLEAIGILAGGIAHDFNNILSAIISFAELTRLENPGNGLLLENQGQILRAAGRAAGLVRQILSFSRSQKPERVPLQLGSVVQEALQLLRSTVPATIELSAEMESGLPEVLADSSQIHQVIVNLVTNAAHALQGAKGLIRVTLDRRSIPPGSPEVRIDLPPGDYVRLTVSDTGEGMGAETLEHIFEPFFTTRGPGQGSGLGLSVVHGIVKDHSGCIVVDSVPGRGSTFTVHLPVASSRGDEVGTASDLLPPGNREQVLFIDDEQPLVEAASRLIDRLGYRCSAFHDPERAWQEFQLEPERFDGVVCDLSMPGMTGLELARKLRTLRPDIPILIATGDPPEIPEIEIHALGIVEVLAKPLDHPTLARSLRRALARRASAPGERQRQ
jgi:PAS domain S-box-containing protein